MSLEKRSPGWRSLPIGAVITKPGNFVERPTGDWRIFRPIVNHEKCIRCLICWVICPEPAIHIVDGLYKTQSGKEYKFSIEIDYKYCKGCLLCAEECPVKAIGYVEEVK